MQIVVVVMHALFLSTLSLRRATSNESSEDANDSNFYPRSPCGERQLRNPSRPGKINFYPRSPCGERPIGPPFAILFNGFLSTLSLRRATCKAGSYKILPRPISIHALLAESDRAQGRGCEGLQDFYPRSPCGERLPHLPMAQIAQNISIHALLAESDLTPIIAPAKRQNFYPRSPCGERRVHYDNYNLHCVISIHALLAESDRDLVEYSVSFSLFLSTLSLRRATTGQKRFRQKLAISIHALLAESDRALRQL